MSKEEMNDVISQEELNILLSSSIIGVSNSNSISFATLLHNEEVAMSLGGLTVDLTKLNGKKFNFSGVNLDHTKIICAKRSDLDFGENSQSVANLSSTMVTTSDDNKMYLLNSKENQIVSFVVDQVFSQTDLLSANKSMLDEEGVCFGLVVEDARRKIKFDMLSNSDSHPQNKKSFIEKLNHKIADSEKARNFAFRTQYYNGLQLSRNDLYKPIEACSNILDNIPEEISESKIIGIDISFFDHISQKQVSHIISVSNIGGKYEIFDHNYGSSMFENKDDADKQIDAMIYHYQKFTSRTEDKEIRCYNLEALVKEADILPLRDISKQDNKARKYKANHEYFDAMLFVLMSTDHPPIQYINELISRGVDINAVDKDGHTPLMIACLNGHEEVVEFLLKKGADINAMDIEGNTALMIASLNGNEEVVRSLISKSLQQDKFLNLDSRNDNGVTALMCACGSGNIEVVQLLIDLGSDVTLVDHNGYSPLRIAAESNHQDIKRLIQGALHSQRLIKAQTQANSIGNNISKGIVTSSSQDNIISRAPSGSPKKSQSIKI